ncbi:MAG: TolB family protein [Solirubrobacterales bacterium]
MKPIRGGLLLGVAVLFALAPALAAYPGANGRIAYAGHVGFGEDDEIFTILPNGPGVKQLTDNSVADWTPSWSASGRHLAFTRGIALYSRQVYTMGAEGQGVTRVTHDNGDDNHPSFSPNGRWIAYSKDNLSTAGPNNARRVSIFTIRPTARISACLFTAARPDLRVLAGREPPGVPRPSPGPSEVRHLDRPQRRYPPSPPHESGKDRRPPTGAPTGATSPFCDAI